MRTLHLLQQHLFIADFNSLIYEFELTKIVFILYYMSIKSTILLYTFLVISFDRYKEYIIFLTSFSIFADVLPAFTCAKVISGIFQHTFVYGLMLLLFFRKANESFSSLINLV